MRLVPTLVAALATALLVTAYAPVAFAEPETTPPSESAEQRASSDSAWGDSKSFWREAVQGQWKLIGPKSVVDGRAMVRFVEQEGVPDPTSMSKAGLSAEQSAQVLEWWHESRGATPTESLDRSGYFEIQSIAQRTEIPECGLTIDLPTRTIIMATREDLRRYTVLSIDENQQVLRLSTDDGQTADVTITLPSPRRLTFSAPSLGGEPLVFRR